MTYTCETCGARFAPWGEEWIYQRGYWWHVPCVSWFGPPSDRLVGFPSGGKGVPDSILHNGPNRQEGAR